MRVVTDISFLLFVTVMFVLCRKPNALILRTSISRITQTHSRTGCRSFVRQIPSIIEAFNGNWNDVKSRTPLFVRSVNALLSCSSREFHLEMANDNSPNRSYSLHLSIPTAEDMEDVGGVISIGSKAGDIILLDGDLGAGKTCFARGFVRGRTGLHDERVTSPTYLLSNSYPVDGGTIQIHHMDLYRLSGSAGELLPLNIDNIFSKGIAIVEWPSRLTNKPEERLDITLTINTGANPDYMDDSQSRFMKIEPSGVRWIQRLQNLKSEGYFDDLLIDS